MKAWITAGRRVVCIDDHWPWVVRQGSDELPVRVPMLNEVLTIAEAKPGNDKPAGGSSQCIYLAFREIPKEQRCGQLAADVLWISTQFRPLDERETDISKLTSLLNTSPAHKTEEA